LRRPGAFHDGQQVEQTDGDPCSCGLDPSQKLCHVDAAVLGRVRAEPPCSLLELPGRAALVSLRGVMPRHGDMHEPLEEVAFVTGRVAPLVLELLVRVEPGTLPE
jgi:hypothetical protein